MKGWTKLACEGCGTETGREKGRVCRDCKKAIDSAARVLPGIAVYEWTSATWGWACFYGSAARIHQTHTRLKEAFYGLVQTVTTPAIEKYRKGTREQLIPSSRMEWREDVLASPLTRARLIELHAAILGCLDEAFQDGKKSGSALLQQLSRGDLSINDLNEEMSSPAEQRSRRRP